MRPGRTQPGESEAHGAENAACCASFRVPRSLRADVITITEPARSQLTSQGARRQHCRMLQSKKLCAASALAMLIAICWGGTTHAEGLLVASSASRDVSASS